MRRTKWRSRTVPVLASLALGCAGLEGIPLEELLRAAGATSSAPLSEATIVSGLREALSVGTQRTVQSTSRRDGFFGNPRIRVPLPAAFEQSARGLRAVGLGSLVDDFEESMNRAAERAAAEATPIFIDAVTSMTIRDARGILAGSERAATDYFEARTRVPLASRFQPVVEAGMRDVGLVTLYRGLIDQIERLPLVPSPRLDLNDYVTQRALDGLFFVLAEEEARIRRDPVARTTELLRRVFGSGGSG